MRRTSNGLFGWALAVLAMGLFCSLGVWQLDRGKQKQAMLAQSQGVLAARKPLPLRAAADPSRANAYDWTQGEGRFLGKPAILLDNQTSEGRSGIRVYRVFQPDVFQPGVPHADAAAYDASAKNCFDAIQMTLRAIEISLIAIVPARSNASLVEIPRGGIPAVAGFALSGQNDV